MITAYYGFSIRIWHFTTNPDNDVHTSGGAYPDIGELFMNTSTGEFFLCLQSGVGTQIWESCTSSFVIQNMIDAIPQADWTQASSSAPDYIKNKPSIPGSQIQSDWIQSNNALLDYIKNKPVLSTVSTTGSYLDLSNKPTIPAAQIQSDWTQNSSASVDFIKNKPPSKSQSSATRSLNTIFQISSTRDTQVVYSVDVSCTSSLLGGQTGTVYLEMSASSTFASGIQELCRFTNANSVALAIAITVIQTNTGVLSSHLIPAGNYVRLRTENGVGSPTFTYRSGQEVLL